jgi:hypothetical protein
MPPDRYPPDDPREWLNRARSNLSRARLTPPKGIHVVRKGNYLHRPSLPLHHRMHRDDAVLQQVLLGVKVLSRR